MNGYWQKENFLRGKAEQFKEDEHQGHIIFTAGIMYVIQFAYEHSLWKDLPSHNIIY